MKANKKLRAYWSKTENDLMLYSPTTQTDGHWLSGIFTKEFTEELKRRGFDEKTMKFSVEPKQ